MRPVSQAWAGITAGVARGIAVHGLTLAGRSEGSRPVHSSLSGVFGELLLISKRSAIVNT